MPFQDTEVSARFRKRFGCIEGHDFTFEACSGLPHVTTCRIAQPPRGGLCHGAAPREVTRPARIAMRLGGDSFKNGLNGFTCAIASRALPRRGGGGGMA